jgi:hypothetical protein
MIYGSRVWRQGIPAYGQSVAAPQGASLCTCAIGVLARSYWLTPAAALVESPPLAAGYTPAAPDPDVEDSRELEHLDYFGDTERRGQYFGDTEHGPGRCIAS